MAGTELPFSINGKDYRRAGLGRLDRRKLAAHDLVLNTLRLKIPLEIKHHVSEQASEAGGRNMDVTGLWRYVKQEEEDATG